MSSKYKIASRIHASQSLTVFTYSLGWVEGKKTPWRNSGPLKPMDVLPLTSEGPIFRAKFPEMKSHYLETLRPHPKMLLCFPCLGRRLRNYFLIHFIMKTGKE